MEGYGLVSFGFHETNSQPLRLLMGLCKIYSNVNKFETLQVEYE
jgi:hypothetical protein